jgi:hypothetical protein
MSLDSILARSRAMLRRSHAAHEKGARHCKILADHLHEHAMHPNTPEEHRWGHHATGRLADRCAGYHQNMATALKAELGQPAHESNQGEGGPAGRNGQLGRPAHPSHDKPDSLGDEAAPSASADEEISDEAEESEEGGLHQEHE